MTIDPRFMKYDKTEVEEILEKADSMLVLATEEEVRSIVTNYDSYDSSSSE